MAPKRKCSVEGCGRPHNARGFCGYHYSKAQKDGRIGRKCKLEGCANHVVANDLCGTHYKRVWVSANRDHYNANMREYQKNKRRPSGKDRDKQLAAGERYRKKNLDRFADKERIRRSTKRANGGTHTIADWRRLLNRYNGLCAYCGTRKATTEDHVVPIARGGTNFIGNILPACVPCNSSKQDKLLIEWRKKK